MNVFILIVSKGDEAEVVLDVFLSKPLAEQKRASYARLNPRDEFDLIEMEVTE